MLLGESTVLVYLAGDNNLEESAIIDLNEMEQIGSTSDINIVVELDRSNGFILVTTTGPEHDDSMLRRQDFGRRRPHSALSSLLKWTDWEM